MRQTIIDALPKELSKVRGCWVAGGFVRDTIAKLNYRDIDLFVPRTVKERFRPDRLNFKPSNRKDVFETSVGPTNVQLIVVDSDIPTWVVQRFDFVSCCGAVELGGDGSYFHNEFERDVHERSLRVNNALALVPSTLVRVMKLVARGWTIEPGELAKVVGSIAVTVPLLKDLMINENDLTKEIHLAIDHHARKSLIEQKVRTQPGPPTLDDAVTAVANVAPYVADRAQVAEQVREVRPTFTQLLERERERQRTRRAQVQPAEHYRRLAFEMPTTFAYYDNTTGTLQINRNEPAPIFVEAEDPLT